MSLPTTREGLKEAGYKFDGCRPCRGPKCKKLIAWFWTPCSPSKPSRRLPLDADTLEPHWATCPDADLFKSNRGTPPRNAA